MMDINNKKETSAICCLCKNSGTASEFISFDKALQDDSVVEVFNTYIPRPNLENVDDPLICSPCQLTISNFASDIDAEKFRDHIIKDTREFEEHDPIVFSNLLVRLIKDPKIDKQCSDFNLKNQDQGTGNIKRQIEDVSIKTEPQDEDDPDRIFDTSDMSVYCHKDSTGKVLYKCPKCTYQGRNKNHLKRHFLAHRSDKGAYSHQCNECSYRGKTKEQLKLHMARHKNPEESFLYTCPKCDFKSIHKRSYSKHVVRHNNNFSKMYKCNQCIYQSIEKYCLDRHMKVHKSLDEVETFKCPLCPYETKYKQSLKTHSVIHKSKSELKLYKCPNCPLEFKLKITCRKHQIMHKSENEITMYKCYNCTFQSKHKESLIKHVERHIDAVFYKCEKCDFKTSRKEDLSKHVMLHKSEQEARHHKDKRQILIKSRAVNTSKVASEERSYADRDVSENKTTEEITIEQTKIEVKGEDDLTNT